MCKHNDGQQCGAPTPTPTSAPGDTSAARTRLQLWLVLAVASVIGCCCFGLILVLGCSKKKKTPPTEKLNAALEVDAVEVLMFEDGPLPDCEEVSKDDAAPYRFAAPPTADPQLSCMLIDDRPLTLNEGSSIPVAQQPQAMVAVPVCICDSPDELDWRLDDTSEA